MNYYVQNIGDLGLNGIKLKWIIGTHGMGAVSELCTNPAHLPKTWAKLAVQISW